MDRLPTWGTTKTLADYVKESAWQTNSSVVAPSSNSTGAVASTSTTSMPWAAAVSKSPPDLHSNHNHHLQHHQHQQNHNQNQHHQQALLGANNHSSSNGGSSNSFDYNGAIGSWTSPETSSLNRGGWNADGSSKADGVFDDGTAIWGNPTTKKTGIDWTEKESLMSPPQAVQANSNSNPEKRIQKPEPAISSIDGTEVWGAPVRNQQQPQQQQAVSSANSAAVAAAAAFAAAPSITKNDISGNIFGTKSSANESSAFSTLGWGESFSRQQQQQQANENSSPPNSSASIWNNLGISKQKSSDWLSASSGISVGGPSPTNTLASSTSSRMDELNKQLEMTSLFDSTISPMAKTSSSPGTNNINNGSPLEQHPIGVGLGGYINNGACSIGGGNNMNDLNKMSANYSNDLLASPNRQSCGLSTRNNQQSQQQQLDSAAAYSSGATPSRDLLKQMVHQIQLAVQAGHLNAHILNQPMSTPTLQLVYQLLQQIKTLHQLQEIQQRAGIKTDMNSPSNMDLQINRIRQNISLLQKAITQQQAALTKNEPLGDPSQASASSSPSSSLSSSISKQPMQQQAAAAAAACGSGKLPPPQSQSSVTSTSSSAWSSAFSSGDFLSQQQQQQQHQHQQQQAWPVFLKTNNAGNNGGSSIGGAQRTPTGLYDWSDLVSSSTMQFANDNQNHLGKQQAAAAAVAAAASTVGTPPTSTSAIGGGRPAPPPGLTTSNFGPIIGTSSSVANGIWSNLNEYTD